MTTRAFAEKRKKQVLRTSVQGDKNEIKSGREEATPHLHVRACAVEVHSTRGSHEGELLIRKMPPKRHNQLTDIINKINVTHNMVSFVYHKLKAC